MTAETFFSVHPTAEGLEAHCFSRLPEPAAAWMERHAKRCFECRRELEDTRLTISILKSVLQGANRVQSKLSAPAAPPIFTRDDLIAARKNLPVSRMITSRCLAALQNDATGLDEVDKLVSQDPGLAAHLVKVANSALLSPGCEVRSVARAVMQLGFNRTRLHLLGLFVKASFSRPELKALWDHSIEVAGLARDLAEVSGIADPDEASLAGLIHDVGRLVLAALGPMYERQFKQRLQRGLYSVDAEAELCGSTHAEIGAELLQAWSFPADMVNAIRYHHAPSLSPHPLSAVLYIAENWTTENEALSDRTEHRLAVARIGLARTQWRGSVQGKHEDLQLLRFVA